MRNIYLANALVFGVPHMIHADKANEIMGVLADRSPLERSGIEGDLMARNLDRRDLDPFPVRDGVATIQVVGTLVNRGAYIGASSGLTSYQGLQAQIQRARVSPRVKAVVFEFDSFGGLVQGNDETADMLGRLSAEKPTMGILSSNACSAAYRLAVECRQIVMPESGITGSIGAVIVHGETSRKDEQEGVTWTLIHAGERKVEGNSLRPLEDETIARWQAQVDATRDRFAEAVAIARSGKITKDAALATEAGCYHGDEALSLGLVDAVAEPSAAFAAFVAAVNAG